MPIKNAMIINGNLKDSYIKITRPPEGRQYGNEAHFHFYECENTLTFAPLATVCTSIF